MSAQGRYGELLGAMARCLQAHGFRGRGPGFRRVFPEVAHVVAVQKSDACTSGRLKFTVNVGLWSRDVSLATGHGEEPPPSASRCHVSARLGEFQPRPQDLWWDVRDGGGLAAALSHVEALVQGGMVPALAGLETAEDLLREWEEGDPALKPEFHHHERYVGLLRQAVESRRGPDRREARGEPEALLFSPTVAKVNEA